MSVHTITIFFPEPGVKPGSARMYLFKRGYLQQRFFGGRMVLAPRFNDRLKTRQKNYLIREISLTVYDTSPEEE